MTSFAVVYHFGMGNFGRADMFGNGWCPGKALVLVSTAGYTLN